MNNNDQMERSFNDDNSSFKRKTKQIEQEEYRMNNLLHANKLQIRKLTKRINGLKSFLISTGNEKLIPKKSLSNIRGKDGLYHCQICQGRTFKSYEQFHTHHIIDHFNSYSDKNILYNSNNFNKMYHPSRRSPP